MRPMARTAGLVVRDLGDETLVYDLERHEAHCLNRTAALVFRHADGRRSVADIALVVAADAHSAVDEDVVRLAIEKLAEAKLIENADAEPLPETASPTRREALRRVALGAALLAPIVTSLLVPTPAEAAATCIPATACTAAKYGQPCYSVSTSECTSKICYDNLDCH
jgi:hypothetical protein